MVVVVLSDRLVGLVYNVLGVYTRRLPGRVRVAVQVLLLHRCNCP